MLDKIDQENLLRGVTLISKKFSKGNFKLSLQDMATITSIAVFVIPVIANLFQKKQKNQNPIGGYKDNTYEPDEQEVEYYMIDVDPYTNKTKVIKR